MTIDHKMWNEKLLYEINRKVANRPSLSSGKNDNYEYQTGEKILPSNRRQIIEKATFT